MYLSGGRLLALVLVLVLVLEKNRYSRAATDLKIVAKEAFSLFLRLGHSRLVRAGAGARAGARARARGLFRNSL